MGGFVDQSINITNKSGVDLNEGGVGIGGFMVWNQNHDRLGAQLRVSMGYSSKDLSITRQIIGNAEAGKGKTELDSYGFSIIGSWAVEPYDRLTLTPYYGFRWTKVKADGYTENDSAFAPLTYSTLAQNTASAIFGIRASKAIQDKFSVYTSAGFERDIHNNGGTYRANSENIAGLESISFNSTLNKFRPSVTFGAHYDIDNRQRLGADLIWNEQAYTSNSSTTMMLRYMIGF